MSGLVKKLVVTFAAIIAVTAMAQSGIMISNEAFVEKVEVAKDGSKATKLLPAKKVLPGEDVIFIITYKNGGEKSATDIVVTNPIPQHMTFKDAAGDKNEVTEVSVDGGKKFDKMDNLVVEGSSKTKSKKETRKAIPSDVTHVRWKLSGALPPKAEGKVRLRVVLN